MIQPLRHVAEMDLYALAAVTDAEDARLVSLAQNESLRAPSPLAVAAANYTLSNGAAYPDPDWNKLRSALASRHGLTADNILCGAGSMELIAALAQCFLDGEHHALASEYSYAFFETAVARVGSRLLKAKEAAFTVNIRSLIESVTAQTRIVFVANPGNPTGTRIPTRDLLALRAALSHDILLVIDEAYGEFTEGLDAPTFDMVETGNTVVLRTFSKAYGLAAMRIGWGYFGPPICAHLRKVLNPNNINSASQAAATAAVLDDAYMRETTRLTSEIRDRFQVSLMQLGYAPPPSCANFILIPFASAEKAAFAQQRLYDGGFILRGMSGYGLPDCLRATISSEHHMQGVINILKSLRHQGDTI
ncbi:pyridoxal phosphate-dependent aminotransferase [Roseobacter sp. EG26]|uniref:pyridoxal phosphate-dependent aminotransferase n=1 Tax=Roseobacter sp. EG26 TaxID=3412477 RepID=UPI003CE5B32E